MKKKGNGVVIAWNQARAVHPITAARSHISGIATQRNQHQQQCKRRQNRYRDERYCYLSGNGL